MAREAAGLSRADIAFRTKIAERHVLAIEEDRFGDLAARTYAVGFARAYARAIGLDEAEMAKTVRRQIDAEKVERPQGAPSFEPGDPARVPPMRLAWLAGGGAVVVIGLLLLFWSSFLSPEGKLPDLLADEAPAPLASLPAALPVPRPSPAGEPVVLTATADNVWVSVTDAGGAMLLVKELAKGESWTVPADARGPQLRTGRPDALQLTVGGKAVPRLAERPMTMSGISLMPADVRARAVPAQSPAASQPLPAPQAPASRPSGMRRPTTGSPRPADAAIEPTPVESTTAAASPATSTGRPLGSAMPQSPHPADPLSTVSN
ncbi:protein of unknown function [Novosphingobium sp. CF614]|uniref:helix-turn-helix domain-containing protein n=1 Tax=Novosphingobium sp. CF614 TaxID=1884364 RepID=UPI0008E29DA9|nr:RodZ domain-containing protein [Novosphingobium sp. CF614]SFF87083.1 protein of unknown function [Novosphingobium sp. CF614]